MTTNHKTSHYHNFFAPAFLSSFLYHVLKRSTAYRLRFAVLADFRVAAAALRPPMGIWAASPTTSLSQG